MNPMKKLPYYDRIKRSLWHPLAIIIFLGLSMVYFKPALEGKILFKGEKVQEYALGKEVRDHYRAHGKLSRWTTTNFSGMPAHDIWSVYPSNIILKIRSALKGLLGEPLDILLIYLLGFYISLICLGGKPWISAAGALAFGFSTFNFLSIEAGQLDQALATGFAAPVLGALWLLGRKKYWPGLLLLSIFGGLLLSTGHLQLTTYLLIGIFVVGVFGAIIYIRKKAYGALTKAIAILGIAGALAILPNMSLLWPAYEHRSSPDSMGVEEVNPDQTAPFSYGVLETLTLFMPGFMGGSINEYLSTSSDIYIEFVKYEMPQQIAKNITNNLPLYWGDQPYVTGPVYYSAVVIFLFVLALFVVKGRKKRILVSLFGVALIISWGKNTWLLHDALMVLLPFMNRFESPSLMLGLANIPVIWLGFLGLQKIFSEKLPADELIKAVRITMLILGAIALGILLAGPYLFDLKPGFTMTDQQLSKDDIMEQEFYKMIPNETNVRYIMETVMAEREALLMTDAFRSLIIVLIAGGLLWGWINRKMDRIWCLLLLTVLLVADLWLVNSRYVNNSDYIREKDIATIFQPRAADLLIMRDEFPHKRVLNLDGLTFADGKLNYHHQNIGGYSAVKLSRYQEVIDRCLKRELNGLADTIATVTPVLNMLNTKYIINGPRAESVLTNYDALGWAWFVKEHRFVKDPQEEINALQSFKPAEEAIIHQDFKAYLEGFDYGSYPFGKIELLSYLPDEITYRSISPVDQLAVFSEIYYKGNENWQTYINGQKADHIRANYILRALRIPAGRHEIQFKYEDHVYATSEQVSMGGSILWLVMITAYFIQYLRLIFIP